MPLAPKISILSTDTLQGKTVVVKDSTGTYNAGTNPGGYGSPNYATSDLDWAVIGLRNYSGTTVSYQKIAVLTDILGTGQSLTGLNNGVFDDGVWELKYYPVVAHPVTPGVDTTITWVAGEKKFLLTNANTVLAGVTAILIKNISDTKLYFIDTSQTITSGQAFVTEELPSAGTGFIALAYEAGSQFMIAAAGDDCIAKAVGRFVREGTCYFDETIKGIYLRMGKRQGADILYLNGNYQATHDLLVQLSQYCVNLNSGCNASY